MIKTPSALTKFILGALVALATALPFNFSYAESYAESQESEFLEPIGLLEPVGFFDRIRKEISKISIRAQVDIVNAALYDGLATALSYRFESEPSYIDGYYTRVDKYQLRINLRPGDFLDDDTEPFGFDIRKSVDVFFARQFKTQKESFTALPYTFRNFPLNADRAIRRMNVGDFVAFQANLSLILSVGAFPEIGGTIGVGASTHVFVSGEFMIHFYRMPNNHIRLKIIALRGQGGGADAGLRFNHGLSLIGLSIVDKGIKKVVGLKPLNLSLEKTRNELFMIDYVFDLNDPAAAQAFNDVIKKKLRFKDIPIANPVADAQQLREAVITDIDSTEKIVHEDYALKSTQRRIQRIFKGSNELQFFSGRFQVGFRVAKFAKGFDYVQNKVLDTDMNEIRHPYLLDTYSIFSRARFLYGMYGWQKSADTSLLFSADEKFNPSEFLSLIQRREVKMKTFREDHFQEFREHVRETLPPAIYTKIDWKNWDFRHGSLPNGYFEEEIFFEPEAISHIPYRDRATIEKTYTEFIIANGRPKSAPHHGIFLDPRRFGDNWIEAYRADLEEIATQLVVIFSPTTSTDQRYESYKKLKRIPIYRETIAGYLLSLLPPNDLDRLLTYKLTMSAKGAPPVSFEFGTFENRNLYESLMYVQHLVTNRNYDLRILIEEGEDIRENTVY